MLKDRRRPQEEPELDPQAEKKAVALKYDIEKNKAPTLVAKGKGHVAENILEAAKKGQMPVYQNKSLVNMLMALELDKEIPTELYTTVAEILAYVYRIDKRHDKKGAFAAGDGVGYMNNKQLGDIGEHIAAEYLTAHGYRIVERNYRSRLGEIDVIAAKNDVLVFVEVKTRTSTRFGRPSEAVNFLKQQKITKVASWYIHNKRLEGRRVRFDVVELLRTPAGQMSVNHIQNAFDAVYR